ncbi:hypothetical protein MVES_002221 [Malassezia vespertilionis]|uniref:Xylanolytic transcriptional activator regulatory domain-containing protein n=2 Tax=Malassezia vespertilionis TaxID=2020962 RepID=A0A2N1JBB5_9BASI|nr:hypothetical protein MVES_002221 [Malassezia vespertilionis]
MKPNRYGRVKDVADLMPGNMSEETITSIIAGSTNLISPAMQKSLMSSMYSKDITKRMLDVFVDTLNTYRYVIPNKPIFDAYDKFYENGGVVTKDNLTQFGLLAATCAIGTMYVTISQLDLVPGLSQDAAYDEFESIKQLCNSAEVACFTAQNIGEKEDIYSVLTYILLSRHHLVRGRTDLMWIAAVNFVRVAFDLGLHRDGTQRGLDDAAVEQTREMWSLVYSMERSFALQLGRTPIILDSACDTKPPAIYHNLDNVPPDMRHLFTNAPPPHLLLINRIRMVSAPLQGDLAYAMHNLYKPLSYARALEIHSEFERFVASELPFYFLVDMVDNRLVQDTRCDGHYSFVKIQRHQLRFDFDVPVLALFSPFLLRKSARPGGKYAKSYEVCLQTVKINLALRHEVRCDESLPKRYRESISSFGWFNTLVVAGIILLKNPPADEVHILRGHMNEFVLREIDGDNPEHNAKLKREVDFIQSFLDKAKLPQDEDVLHIAKRQCTRNESRSAPDAEHSSVDQALFNIRAEQDMLSQTRQTMCTLPLDMNWVGVSQNGGATDLEYNPMAPFNATPYHSVFPNQSLSDDGLMNLGEVLNCSMFPQTPMIPAKNGQTSAMAPGLQTLSSDMQHHGQDTQQLLYLW